MRIEMRGGPEDGRVFNVPRVTDDLVLPYATAEAAVYRWMDSKVERKVPTGFAKVHVPVHKDGKKFYAEWYERWMEE